MKRIPKIIKTNTLSEKWSNAGQAIHKRRKHNVPNNQFKANLKLQGIIR